MIPRTVLVAMESFGEGLDAARAGAAIGRGLSAGAAIGRGRSAGDPTLAVDLCPIEPGKEERRGVRELLDTLGFDARMRAARAVVVGAARLDEDTLLGSATFEIATRARQAGVPAYAVAGENALSLFDARVLDLQVVLLAHNTRALRRAGEKLAGLMR